ncbi:hypothetical protein O988_09185, partial [Pseudogymnoascus sp. VKM F-3808]
GGGGGSTPGGGGGGNPGKGTISSAGTKVSSSMAAVLVGAVAGFVMM